VVEATIVACAPEPVANFPSFVVVAYGVVALATVHVVAVVEDTLMVAEAKERVDVEAGDWNEHGVEVDVPRSLLRYSYLTPLIAKYGEAISGPDNAPNFTTSRTACGLSKATPPSKTAKITPAVNSLFMAIKG